jgi:antitoxin MazE
MKVRVVRIGNSKGVRIPSNVLKSIGVCDAMDLTVEGDSIVLTPSRVVREGWDEQFRAAGEDVDDNLWLMSSAPNEFDEKEWTW